MFFVPGRIEVLGKHTDYAGGRSLLSAVERGFVAVARHRTDTVVRVIDAVRGAIEADPKVGGRLALWGRRLMGEALSQAQRVAVERDALAALLAGGADRPGMDLAAIGRMFSRLTEAHADRMSRLGLDS